jgi:hypothetical protein
MSLNCNKCGGVKTLQKRKYVNKGVVNVYEYYYCNACIAEKARNVRKGIKFLKVKTAALVERKRILKPADELNLNIDKEHDLVSISQYHFNKLHVKKRRKCIKDLKS